MRADVIDDLANRRNLEPVLAMGAREELSLEEISTLACGHASPLACEKYGEHWLATLLDLLQRGGVGRLERRADDRVVFVFASELPSAEEAWERAWSAARRR
jgi:hypothetical protein